MDGQYTGQLQRTVTRTALDDSERSVMHSTSLYTAMPHAGALAKLIVEHVRTPDFACLQNTHSMITKTINTHLEMTAWRGAWPRPVRHNINYYWFRKKYKHRKSTRSTYDHSRRGCTVVAHY